MKKKVLNFLAIVLIVLIIVTLIVVVNKYIKAKQVKASINESNIDQKNSGDIQFTNVTENQGNIQIENEVVNNTNVNETNNVENSNVLNEENNKNTEQQKNENNKKNKSSNSVNGVIFLTFDDGPSSNITPKVLDILKKEDVKATFFVLNYSQANEHLIQRIVNEGHTIGIHGYSHEYSKIYKSKDAFLNNVYTLQEKIKKSTGVTTMYMRFPGGSSNTVSRHYKKGIMTELSKEMLKRGFKYFDWNVSSGDAGGAKNAKKVYKNVTKNLSKKRGNMVLMHDFASNKKGLEALPKIIKYAKEHGYTFSAINDNTPMYGQHINN